MVRQRALENASNAFALNAMLVPAARAAAGLLRRSKD
jgi:hypothetical protein